MGSLRLRLGKNFSRARTFGRSLIKMQVSWGF